ncbi:protein O-mannosyltransferase rt [Brevipalpus obovatus]|uniref:protein O-mannosyltransferase rt n=1 Tax=Brevipalpus obovatus TaxID=246614 RepID=UPI003D9DE126
MTESKGSTNQNSQSKISTVLKNGIKNSSESSDDIKSNSIGHKQSNGSTQCKLISSSPADRDFEKRNSPSSHSLFTIIIQIDIVAWSCFLIAFLFRVYLIGYPSNIVFDELHYGKFVSLYLKGIFYFDSQPPLGKQLIAAAGYLAGYDGSNAFMEIGGSYGDNVPLKALRFVPILFGSLLVPVIYHLILELGFSNKTAALGALFIILDNALLTQSRFILMDSILIFWSMCGLWAFLKFRKQPLLHTSWFGWLFLSSTFLSCAFCVKFVGLYTFGVALFVALYDLWWSLPNKSIPTRKLWYQSLVYVISFLIWPLAIYFSIFYLHLSILTRAGPHDNIMTSAFQASLEGGLASITKGQPLEIVHGSQITLRHTHGRTCWLHSHAPVYPVKYSDGRGSSHQQQVTCYSFKDVNNWWIVKRSNLDDLTVSEPRDRIKHGDIIQLAHGMTSRLLNSHDVAAPLSPQHQEVSCYIDYNISMPAQNLWRIELINKDETNGYWHTIRSRVRLIHVDSSQALKFSGKLLPDWGFNQHEVVTDRLLNQDDTIWNVEEHRYTKLSDQKERERDMVDAEFVPLAPTQLSFWEKMKELQYKMISFDQENIPDHMFACDSPIDWLFLTKGIAYWIDPNSNAQIYLIGNPFLWLFSLFSIFSYLLIGSFYLLRRRRKLFDITESDWTSFVNIGLVCVSGYFLNFLPHFFIEKTLFLHHYLPSLIFQILILVTLLEHLSIWLSKSFFGIVVIPILAIAVYFFKILLPFSYGNASMSAEEINQLSLMKTWNFLIHK